MPLYKCPPLPLAEIRGVVPTGILMTSAGRYTVPLSHRTRQGKTRVAGLDNHASWRLARVTFLRGWRLFFQLVVPPLSHLHVVLEVRVQLEQLCLPSNCGQKHFLGVYVQIIWSRSPRSLIRCLCGIGLCCVCNNALIRIWSAKPAQPNPTTAKYG